MATSTTFNNKTRKMVNFISIVHVDPQRREFSERSPFNFSRFYYRPSFFTIPQSQFTVAITNGFLVSIFNLLLVSKVNYGH